MLTFSTSTTFKIAIEWTLAPNHTSRTRIINHAVDFIVQEFTKTKQHRYDRDEDGLTVDIVSMLKSMSIDAKHDVDIGGHCDVTVEARDEYLWIAEAKIHSSYGKLIQGFNQLTTRYSTGLPGQDNGCVLLYCKGARADRIMAAWLDHLSLAKPEVTVSAHSGNPLVRYTEHIHEATGLPYHVRHVAVPLHWNPQDRG